MKQCSSCGRDLPTSCFHKDKSRKDGLATRCKECTKAYHNTYYQGPGRKSQREAAWKRQGIEITWKEYLDLKAKQKGLCAICKRPESKFKQALAVDHDHRTGQVRGLLCNYCNSKLMKFIRDNRRRALGLAAYLMLWFE